MDLLELMRKRRSIRKYQDEKIPDEKLKKIIQAGLLAPSGRNAKSAELIVVRDKEMLWKLATVRSAQKVNMLAGADAAIVVFGNTAKTDTWVEDTCLSMAHMYLMAEAEGIGCCWSSCRLRNCEDGTPITDRVRELLNVPPHFELEGILALGFSAETKDGYSLDSLQVEQVHQETY